MRIKGTKNSKRFARRLRRNLTLPEVMLWQQLRRQAGLRFRKQSPAGDYVLDFFCAPARLAIEVDGEAHNRGDRPERDAERDTWLASEGILVMRIPAVEVFRDLDAVVTHILGAV